MHAFSSSLLREAVLLQVCSPGHKLSFLATHLVLQDGFRRGSMIVADFGGKESVLAASETGCGLEAHRHRFQCNYWEYTRAE